MRTSTAPPLRFAENNCGFANDSVALNVVVARTFMPLRRLRQQHTCSAPVTSYVYVIRTAVTVKHCENVPHVYPRDAIPARRHALHSSLGNAVAPPLHSHLGRAACFVKTLHEAASLEGPVTRSRELTRSPSR